MIGNLNQRNQLLLFSECLDGGAPLHESSWCFPCPSFMGRSTDAGLLACRECLPDHIQDESNEQSSLELCSVRQERQLGEDGSSKVCATDGDVKVLDNLRYNMKLNGLRGDDSLVDSIHDQESEVNQISCHQLIWDENLKNFEVNHGKFPVIMGTDVFYASESVGPLWNTVDGLLESDGVFLLAFAPHKVSIAQVLDKATQLGFTWDKPNISGTAEDKKDDEHDYSRVALLGIMSFYFGENNCSQYQYHYLPINKYFFSKIHV